MTRSRDRRPKPQPRTAEEDAVLEAKYRLLFRRIKRFTARTMAREGDNADAVQFEAARPPLTDAARPAGSPS